MKVAILTLTPSHNYGGILQAVALYSYFKNSGFDVVLVNKKLHLPLWKRVVTKLLGIIPFQNIKNKKSIHKKIKALESFVDANIPNKTRKIITTKDLKMLCEYERFDAIVVGSDQVWRYQYINDGHFNVYFLDFELSFPVRRIAYAASFGKDEWEAPQVIPQVSEMLNRFDAISTREKSGVTLCCDKFDVPKACNTVDPTILVGAEFYDRYLIDLPKGGVDKTVVTYILDENTEKNNIVRDVVSVFNKKGIEHKVINLSQKGSDLFYSVEEWLWNIKNAEFVITDSFHGMVFSILFEKNFLVIGNSARGLSRFTDLLECIGLKDRLVTLDFDDFDLLEKKIEYKDVNEKIEQMREFSKIFLLNSLVKK